MRFLHVAGAGREVADPHRPDSCEGLLFEVEKVETTVVGLGTNNCLGRDVAVPLAAEARW